MEQSGWWGLMTVQSFDQEGVGFSHEGAFYDGPTDLVPALLPFLLEGIDRGEPTLVVMLADRVQRLREALGQDADRVEWIDMAAVGANPARIIPAWNTFLHDHAGEGSVRGIGEPIWAGRREAELAEAQLHEALLNVAFDEGPAWRLVCPYDTASLPQPVLDEALRDHPVTNVDTGVVEYAGHEHARRAFSSSLPEPLHPVSELGFGPDDLATVRAMVRRACEAARLHPSSADDLVLAAHEVAANSVQHAGGSGILRLWDEPGLLAVEVRDAGVIHDPLVGRSLLDMDSEHGRGIWMANQLCDLVQVRSGSGGTQVRLHAWL